MQDPDLTVSQEVNGTFVKTGEYKKAKYRNKIDDPVIIKTLSKGFFPHKKRANKCSRDTD